jgi:uncharacterized protein
MPQPLPALSRGSLVFLDSNIFVYGLLGESQQCLDLMERCHKEEVTGVTSTEVIGEVCHRLMVKEAVDAGLISRPTAYALKPKHNAIRRLRRYWNLTERGFQLNLAVLGSDEARHRAAQQVRQRHGLLTNDSLIVAACFEHEIRSLATRDADFDPIPELTVYRPSDLG